MLHTQVILEDIEHINNKLGDPIFLAQTHKEIVGACRFGLLARDLQSDGAPRSDVVTDHPQDIRGVSDDVRLNIHELASTIEILHDRVKMVIRDVEPVMCLADNLFSYCRGSSKPTHSDGGELSAHRHFPVFAGLKVGAYTSIQSQTSEHSLRNSFDNAFPTHAVKNCATIHELGMSSQPARPSQECRTNRLQAHDHLIHCLIIKPQAGEGTLHVEQKAVELVIGNTQSTVNLS
mmetsp:Transcript_1170/g.2856  ORF Transcript_1170/g.2856 Transcript_1170/m.2856 type:complete len:234 (+) Transcript_1170:1925-2626(+)